MALPMYAKSETYRLVKAQRGLRMVLEKNIATNPTEKSLEIAILQVSYTRKHDMRKEFYTMHRL